MWLILFNLLISLIGSLLIVSSPSFFIQWIGVEISSIFFIPIIHSYLNSGLISSWKYFVIQSLSSFLLLFSLVINEVSSVIDSWMMAMSLMIKLGMFPYWGWGIQISENLTWISMFLLMSIQKIPPLLLLFQTCEISSFMEMALVINVTSMVFLFYLPLSIHWLMMISSLFNTSWLTVSTFCGSNCFLFYIVTYFFYLMIICMSFHTDNVNETSMGLKSSGEWMNGVLLIVSTSFLMGLPPLGSFIGKMMVLTEIHSVSVLSSLTVFSLLMSSALASYFYFKVCFSLSMELSSSFTHLLKGVWISGMLIYGLLLLL